MDPLHKQSANRKINKKTHLPATESDLNPVSTPSADSVGKEILENPIETLSLREDHYGSLFDNLSEAFALHNVVCDENGTPCNYRFLEMNLAFEPLTGLQLDKTIGKLTSGKYGTYHPLYVG